MELDKKRFIYLDNAATTKVSEPVLKAMMPYLSNLYGNASSAYDLGKMSRDAIDQARKYIADLINAEPEEIYFTSGGSEANNWAIKGLERMKKNLGLPFTIVTNEIEHPSVINACGSVAGVVKGNDTVFQPETPSVDRNGFVVINEEAVASADLVSVMFANNEIGTIQPIAEIGKMCRDNDTLFHTDAVQAFGHIPIDVKAMNIDMLSASGHKIHAPKGIGCLYIRKGVEIEPLIHGGHQERSMRAGTENVAFIVGFGEAAYQAKRTMKKRMKKTETMRDYLWERIRNEIPDCFMNGDRKNRLPSNLNITFEGIEGESLVLMMDKLGICISAGSACTTGDVKPSHVLKAIGLTDEQAHGTVRISLDEKLKLDDANYVVESLKKCVDRLRKY